MSEGASVFERLKEATKWNNVDDFHEILGEVPQDDQPKTLAQSDALGNTLLHVAALNGSYEVMDLILDIVDDNVNAQNLLEGSTALHNAVKYSKEEPEHGVFIAEVLIEAGADPRIKNKQNLKPIDLALDDNAKMLQVLQGAELAYTVKVPEDVPEGLPEGQGDDGPSDEE